MRRLLLPLTLLLLACGEKADDTATSEEEAEEETCEEEFVELPAQGMPGWTPAAGCEVLCEDLDAGGLVYHDCYLAADETVWCRYEAACE